MIQRFLAAVAVAVVFLVPMGTVHADSNTRIVLVPAANGAREVGWSSAPTYGRLDDGHLPGKLFQNGVDRDLDSVRGYTDSGELKLRYVGAVDQLQPADDDIYGSYIVRISAGGQVRYRGSLAAIVSVAAGARSIALDIPTDQFRLADYIGREVVIELDYDEIGDSINNAPGGLVFAQIVLSIIGMLVGLKMGPVIAVFGALTGSFILPIFGLGGPEMWFFGTIIVLLAVGGAFAWRFVLARG